jgi:FAD/FMN-containing dehydrogenase
MSNSIIASSVTLRPASFVPHTITDQPERHFDAAGDAGVARQPLDAVTRPLPWRFGILAPGFVQGALPPAGIATMLEWIGTMPGVPSRLPEPAVAFFGFGGKVKDVAPEATAFVHRRDDVLFTCSALWEPQDAPDLIATNIEWLEGFYAAMQPYFSGGAFQNFPDRGLADWQRAYYGANLERLVDVKRAWDPDNLFRFSQSIPVQL